ncbi:hypothetical protein D1BOALGB6SA_584 [Olavius sp. associated proteobacterium Delta 1]|nr:hypothetical protein D1BOALGB6SA_584 [Olavius sp. associated proteobacterium Delta 1]
MNNKLKKIIQHALDAFHKTMGLTIQHQPQYKDGYIYPDGIIRIAHKKKEWYFAPEVKTSINRTIVGMGKLHPLNNEEKMLLITDVVTPPMADLLKQTDIPYIDTAGNAYINEPPLYIFVKGNKARQILVKEPLRRLFKPAGLKVIFALLNNPSLVNKPYRIIAEAAGVALGTVGWVINDMKEMLFVLDMGKAHHKLLNLENLLKRWIEVYPEQLRPKQIIARFETDNQNWWQQANIKEFGAFWGGEVAAAKLASYLKPARVTIYTDQPPGKLVFKNRLRKADHGNVEVLTPFWNFDYGLADEGIVPPLLIYADLMATGDNRNIEMAGIIYEQYLARLVREN